MSKHKRLLIIIAQVGELSNENLNSFDGRRVAPEEGGTAENKKD